MSYQKIAGPMLIMSSTSAGTPKEYRLPPASAGMAGGQFGWMVRVLERSAATVEVGLAVEHGPDGTVAVQLSSTEPITPTTLTTVPEALFGQADDSKIMGPFVHLIVQCDIASGSSAEWAMVEVYQQINRFS